MSLFLVLKFVHIASAIIAVGTNVTYAFWMSRAGTDRDRLVETIDGIRRLDSRIANPAYIVLLLTGIAMVLNLGYSLTTLWIAAALVLYVLVAIVGIVLYAPALRRQRAEAVADPSSAAYRGAELRSNVL